MREGPRKVNDFISRKKSEKMEAVKKTVVDTVIYGAKIAEPYTSDAVKGAVKYSLRTAAPIASGTVDYASRTVDYAQKTVIDTVDFAQKTVHGTVGYAQKTVHNASNFASSKATSAFEFGKVVVNGATTTIHAHTPGPVLALIQSTVEGATAIRQDPIGAVKAYVPAFIFNIGEKSYEVVSHVSEQTTDGIKKASGVIVTKVNGTTQYVTSVPFIATLIDRLNAMTRPIIDKFGTESVDGSISAVTSDVAPAAEPVMDHEQ